MHRELSRLDKVLLVLATFDSPCSLTDVKERAAEAGFKIPTNWNLSQILGRSKGLAIRLPAGWELAQSGVQHLRSNGVSRLSPAAVQVATDLRAYLQKISNDEVRNYVEEAIKCHEAELYNSAIVMSWLAAIAVLQRYVLKNHLTAFNAEAKRVNPKWKGAKTTDDFGEMKEFDFLERLQGISVIGKNRKDELQKALKLRNGCGHPNSLNIGANMAAAHIELILLNVFNV